jgi:hypothetical protein
MRVIYIKINPSDVSEFCSVTPWEHIFQYAGNSLPNETKMELAVTREALGGDGHDV